MEVWISSEAMIDIEEPLHFASNDVEQELNKSVGSKDYGAGVIEWALIYIIMDEDDPNYPEIRRYKKGKREVEFRLKVDHQAFKKASAVSQRTLLAAALLRSIDLSSKLKIANFDRERFREDVLEVFRKNQWA